MVLCCIIEFFFGILILIELFCGYERLWIIWNLLGLDWGIIFKGNDINGVYCGVENGFVICLRFKFYCIWFLMILCFKVELWFFDKGVVGVLI